MVFTIEGNKDEMVAALAAMICYDGKVDLTAASIGSIATAAGTECAPAYATAFAAVCDGVDISKMLKLRGGGGGGGGGAGGAGGAAAEAEKEEGEDDEAEEEAEAMDLFGGGDDDE